MKNTLVYLSYIFSIVTKKLQPTDPVGDDDIWDIYGCDIGYISDVLVHMIVSVIEKLKCILKGPESHL
jgi:hypothetical protein